MLIRNSKERTYFSARDSVYVVVDMPNVVINSNTEMDVVGQGGRAAVAVKPSVKPA